MKMLFFSTGIWLKEDSSGAVRDVETQASSCADHRDDQVCWNVDRLRD